MDQDVRNLDLDWADLAACATQGRGEGKGVNRILLIQALGELRGEDRANGTGVDRTIGVARSVLVDRADVHAGPTTDARKSLATNRVGQGLSAAVIHQNHVEFLGAISGGDTGPHRGVGVHALASCRTGKQLSEDLNVLVTRNQLLNTHKGNESIGKSQAHAAVTFGLEDRDGTGFCDAHVCSRNCNLCVKELLTKVRAGSGREFLRIVGKISGSVFHAVEEDSTDLGTIAVNCRNNDVAGHVVSKLNDHFREVGFARGDAFVLEELVEVRFLGRH